MGWQSYKETSTWAKQLNISIAKREQVTTIDSNLF
jgi:hypothetical protein